VMLLPIAIFAGWTSVILLTIACAVRSAWADAEEEKWLSRRTGSVATGESYIVAGFSAGQAAEAEEWICARECEGRRR